MKILRLAVIFTLLTSSAFSQASEEDRRSNQPVEPFRVAGNLYYVGASEVTSFLITSPKGHILIDGGFAETVPQIKANIQKLGFRLTDVEYLLNTQAHFDHAGGLAELKRLTGAKLLASPGDRPLLERGGRGDFAFGDRFLYEPVRIDQTISDRANISVGGETVTAVFTPGHTKGCTSWTYTAREGRRKYNVTIVCSTTSPGFRFFGDNGYPTIIRDFERTFATLRSLPTDIFLGAHGSFFGLTEKAEKLRAGSRKNPFIDPQGYKKMLATSEADFRQKLAEQRANPQ